MMAPQKPVVAEQGRTVSMKLRGAPVDPHAEMLVAVGEMAGRLIDAIEAIADQMDLISLVVKRYGEKSDLITAKDFEEEGKEAPDDGSDPA